jgi:hypothetical protein
MEGLDETARENIRQASQVHSTIQYYEDPVAAIKASLQLHMGEEHAHAKRWNQLCSWQIHR